MLKNKRAKLLPYIRELIIDPENSYNIQHITETYDDPLLSESPAAAYLIENYINYNATPDYYQTEDFITVMNSIIANSATVSMVSAYHRQLFSEFPISYRHGANLKYNHAFEGLFKNQGAIQYIELYTKENAEPRYKKVINGSSRVKKTLYANPVYAAYVIKHNIKESHYCSYGMTRTEEGWYQNEAAVPILSLSQPCIVNNFPQICKNRNMIDIIKQNKTFLKMNYDDATLCPGWRFLVNNAAAIELFKSEFAGKYSTMCKLYNLNKNAGAVRFLEAINKYRGLSISNPSGTY